MHGSAQRAQPWRCCGQVRAILWLTHKHLIRTTPRVNPTWFSSYIDVFTCVIYMCVCMCVCRHTHTHTYIYIYIYIYTYIYIYIYVYIYIYIYTHGRAQRAQPWRCCGQVRAIRVNPIYKWVCACVHVLPCVWVCVYTRTHTRVNPCCDVLVMCFYVTCVSSYIDVCTCGVCVCVCIHTHTHAHTYIDIYMAGRKG